MAELSHEAGNGLQARAFLERYLAVGSGERAGTVAGSYRIERGLGDAEQAARYAQRLKKEFPNSTETGELLEAEHAAGQ